MSLLLLDGFEYGTRPTNEPSHTMWQPADDGALSTAQVRSGAYSATLTANQNMESIFHSWDATTDTLHAAFAIRFLTQITEGAFMSIGADLSLSARFYLVFYATSTGRVRVYAADSVKGTDILLGAESATGIVAADTWHHIEVVFRPDDTVGVGRIWVDGIEPAGTGETSGDTSEDAVGGRPTGVGNDTQLMFHATNPQVVYIDDVVFWTGETVGNDPFDGTVPMGDMIIEGLVPTVISGAEEFTPVGQAANVDNVDLIPVDDTEYNEDDVADERDMFVMADRTHTGTPLAVSLLTRAQMDDAGPKEYEPILDGSSLQVQSAIQPANGTMVDHVDLFPVDIDAAVWTNAKVNAIEAGYEVV